MKQTSPNPLVTSVMAVSLLVVLCGAWVVREHSALETLSEEHAALISQAKAYEELKSRWSGEESRSDLEYLKNHPNLLKQEKRGGNLYLEFGNLSSGEFNRISNTLLNSLLVIKKMTLRRDGASRGVIIVEIES